MIIIVGRRTNDLEPLLKQHVPECYIKLQDIIRGIAARYAKEKRHPVLTTEEIRYSKDHFIDTYYYNYVIIFVLFMYTQACCI